MRSQRLASHSGLSPSLRKSVLLTAPEPMSMPTVVIMSVLLRLSCACLSRLPFLDHGSPGEGRAAERSGVDRIGIDVERQCAVVLANEILERLDRSFVLGDAAGKGELVANDAGAGEDRHGAQHDGAVQA